jgi:membrane-associated phospholipid phosphatase
MTKQRSRAAALLLLVILPLSLSSQGGAAADRKTDPTPRFSLASRYPASAPAISGRALSVELSPSVPPLPETFSFGSITGDFLKDAGEIWTYPLHIRTQDILPLASLAVLTGFLIGNDESIREEIWDYRTSHSWVKAVSPVITNIGSYGAWGIAAAFLLFGRAGGKSLETGILATSAILQSGLLVNVLKGLFGRQRPFWDNGVDRWNGPVGFFDRIKPGNYGRYDSFPGGHSITAWSLATVLAMQYGGEHLWVPILAYTTATGVALSRVTEGKHWLSDCVVGSVLGYVVGRMVVLNHRSRYHIAPSAGIVNGTPSFAVTFSVR